MHADLIVVSQEEYDQWVDDQLTLTLTLEDADGEPFDDPVEITLEGEDFSETYSEDDLEDGVLEVTVEEGGDYELTIESPDDEFETVEEDISIVDGPEETITVGEPEEDNGDEDDDNDDNDDNDENGGDD